MAPGPGRSLRVPHLTKASCSCVLLIPCISFILPVFPLQSGSLQTFNSSACPELLSKRAVIKSIPRCWPNRSCRCRWLFFYVRWAFSPLKARGFPAFQAGMKKLFHPLKSHLPPPAPSSHSPVVNNRVAVCAERLVRGGFCFLSRKNINPVAQHKRAPYGIN